MGFVHKGQRKVAVVLHLRPSREQAAGNLESQALRWHHCRVQTRCAVDETNATEGGSANKSLQSRRDIFAHLLRGIFLWGAGALAAERWSSLRPEARRPCKL
jgi:hypothetical protein